MLYLTLVVFFLFLLVVLYLVKLLFQLNKHDSYSFDREHLWKNRNISAEEMKLSKQKKR